MLLCRSEIETVEEKGKFETIYLTYHKRMLYVAWQILRDESLAEDAVQDSFIKIIENMDKISNIHSNKTKSFITIIVRNHSINLYNKRKKEFYVPLEKYENTLLQESVSDMDTELFWEGSDSLGKAMLKLPVIYKDILILKYIQEMSNSEIATFLSITQATARKRMERAKHKLLQLLAEEGSALPEMESLCTQSENWS